MQRRLFRAGAVLATASALCAGAVGLTHTSAGRPVWQGLVRMAHGGCPFGYDKPVSAAERERGAAAFAKSHRGTLKAANRPALGFGLDTTTREEIVAAMTERGVVCSAARGMADLTCSDVPSSALPGASALPATRNLWFTFGESQRLLSVVSISRAPTASPISAAFLTAARELEQQAGAPTRTRGDAEPTALARGLLRQAKTEFRFSDYYAFTEASNLGSSFMLTEEYRLLPD